MSSIYPEMGAGGYSRRDGTIQFYTRVNALLQPHWTALDLGAGRGSWLEQGTQYKRDLRMLKGKVAKVIGADIDAVVTTNQSCDESVVMPDSDTLPLDANSVDLIVSDHTFEHVENPVAFVAEVQRVLRPGGWIAARTPNRWGYIGLATNAVPNSLHVSVLKRAQPDRLPEDVFPTIYRMNTRRAISALFPTKNWEVHMYPHNPEPAYFGNSAALLRVADAVLSRAPNSLSATWSIFIRRR